MSFILFEIACGQRAEVRVLASTYVARYGQDALPLARIARADLLERNRHARAAIYDQVIDLLALRVDNHRDARRAPSKLRMTISDTLQVPAGHQRRYSQQHAMKLLQMSPSEELCS